MDSGLLLQHLACDEITIRVSQGVRYGRAFRRAQKRHLGMWTGRKISGGIWLREKICKPSPSVANW